jgi:hypothetical protein
VVPGLLSLFGQSSPEGAVCLNTWRGKESGEAEHLPCYERREPSEVSEVEEDRQPKHPGLENHLRLAKAC